MNFVTKVLFPLLVVAIATWFLGGMLTDVLGQDSKDDGWIGYVIVFGISAAIWIALVIKKNPNNLSIILMLCMMTPCLDAQGYTLIGTERVSTGIVETYKKDSPTIVNRYPDPFDVFLSCKADTLSKVYIPTPDTTATDLKLKYHEAVRILDQAWNDLPGMSRYIVPEQPCWPGYTCKDFQPAFCGEFDQFMKIGKQGPVNGRWKIRFTTEARVCLQ